MTSSNCHTPAPEAQSPGPNAPGRRQRSAEITKLEAELQHTYFPQKSDEDLLDRLNDLLDTFENYTDAVETMGLSHVGRLKEGRALAIVGASGVGKSRSLERAFESLGMNDRKSPFRIISIKAPSPCTLKQLGTSVLQALGYPVRRELRENVVWRKVRDQLKLHGIRFLHLDELQHLTQLENPNDSIKVCDTLKGLMQDEDWPVWLVLSGMPNLAAVIESDFQLRRRCTFVRLDLMTPCANDLQTVQRIIKNYCKKAKLEHQNLPMNELCSRLMHGAEGRTGYLIEIVQDALCKALKARRNMPLMGDFELTFEARTGCRPEHNVFAEDVEWQNIDVRNTLFPEDKEEDEVPQPKNRRLKIVRGA